MHIIAECVIHLGRGQNGVRLCVIALLESIPVAEIHRRRFIRSIGQGDIVVRNPRNAVVWHVVLAQIEQAQRGLGLRAQTKRDRRRDAPALVVGLIAAGDILFVVHEVDARRSRLAARQGVVRIQRRPAISVGTARQSTAGKVVQMRDLAHQVDVAPEDPRPL